MATKPINQLAQILATMATKPNNRLAQQSNLVDVRPRHIYGDFHQTCFSGDVLTILSILNIYCFFFCSLIAMLTRVPKQ